MAAKKWHQAARNQSLGGFMFDKQMGAKQTNLLPKSFTMGLGNDASGMVARFTKKSYD